MIKSKIEIINETVAYYSEDPSRRAIPTKDVDPEYGIVSCLYKTKDGRMCAAGRLFNWDEIEDIDDLNNSGSIGNVRFVESLFKEEYRGQDTSFWSSLQNLHDNDDYWDENGMTEEGKEEYNRLIKMYSN